MKLKEVFGDYGLGKEIRYRNLTLVPVIGKKRSGLEYSLLSEAVEQGMVEISETGNVNKLRMTKRTPEDILVIKGECIKGGMQNRQLTVNGLIRRAEIDIPVHCVQQGRWSYGSDKHFDVSPVFMAASVRGATTKDGAYGAQQSQTWGSIHRMMAGIGAESASSDYVEVVEKKRTDINDYLNKFSPLKGQTGIIAVINKEHVPTFFADIFDNSETLEKHFRRIVSSYAVDAIAAQSRPIHNFTEEFTPENFIDFILTKIDVVKSKSLDLGEDYELRSNNNARAASALVYNDNVVYLNAHMIPLIRADKFSDEPRQEFPDPIRQESPNPIVSSWDWDDIFEKINVRRLKCV